MEKFHEIFDKVWDFKLIDIGQHQSIAVKQIVIAIIVSCLGYLAAKLIRRHVRHVLESKSKLSAHGVQVVEKTVFYSSVVLAIFIAIDVVHIPLTAFAFLGGGIAVGIGFGAKNLFNNFISGFILFFERPIKVGDVVQVEDEIGVIEDIGLRSTRIHTENNIHILLPNSDLLEKKIINWTMLDNLVLTDIEIGLAYGTDADQATKLMIDAIKKCDFIESKPDPFVLFWNFADSSLTFRIFFPIKIVNKMERWEKESKIRYTLYKILTEAGIVIAFPQRDVHLNASAPLEVSLTNSNSS